MGSGEGCVGTINGRPLVEEFWQHLLACAYASDSITLLINMATLATTKTRKVEMNEEDKYMNEMIIQRMNKRVNFLKNPRFKESKRPIAFTDIQQRQELIHSDTRTPFKALPSQVIFRDYFAGTIYELDLCLTNTSSVLKRIKYMPPASPEFAIGSIRYPSATDGYIAPGMSVYLTVRFNPSSSAEFDDEITILTEDNIFKVPLLARKELPSLNLPSSLDCKSCWLGDELDVRFKVTNTGGEAGYRFQNEADEDDIIRVGNFEVRPASFFLAKGHEQEIMVRFKPSAEGQSFEELVLACDNQTTQTIRVVGGGNTVELAIAALDSVPLDTSEPFTRIFFKQAVPNKLTNRRLTILNKTSVEVKFHWTMNDEEGQHHFSIEPNVGSFKPNEAIEFVIGLKSGHYVPLFEYANLVIDEIPIQAIRNPPESIKTTSTAATRPSITYYEFELLSFSALCTVNIEPPFYVFANALSVGTIAKRSFQITNPTECTLQFEVSPHLMSSSSVMTHIGTTRGEIGPNKMVQLEVGIGSEIIGTFQKVAYRVDFDYSHSQSIELVATFEAARISVSLPMVDFGLIKTNSHKAIKINITNLSGVTAIVDLSTESGTSKLTCNPDSLQVPPQGSVEVEVDYCSIDPETYHDFLVLQVRGGLSTVLEIFAEVQSPAVSLNRVLLEVECLYSSNTYTFDERAQQNIIIQNLGNIPTPFNWDEPSDQSRYLVKFDPCKGVVPPKSNLPIKFSIKPKQGGVLEEIFVCDVEGVEFPLGFELKTNVLGLSVEYELIEDGPAGVAREIGSQASSRKSPSSTPSKRKSNFRQSLLSKTGQSKASSKTRKTQQVEIEEDPEPAVKTQKMNTLDFFNCTISQPKQMKFLLKNTSGIHTQYRFFMETYEPKEGTQENSVHDEEGTKSVHTKSIRFGGQQDGKSSNSRSIIKKNKIIADGRPTVLLTDRVEKTRNFTSSAGQKLNYQKKLEHDARQYLSNNLGVAVVCEPSRGALPAYGSVVVTVTCFNDICGLFNDSLCAEIRGLDIVKFPVTVDVKGSPLVITKNQLGIHYGEDTLFDLGSYMRNSGSITRDFRVTNTGPKDVELEWKVYLLGGNSNKQGVTQYLDIKIADPPLGSSKACEVQFIGREPEESTEGPFQIHPKHERVRGRREKHFTIDFHTGERGVYNAVLVGRPRLLDQSTLGAISLLVRAETLQPSLYLDKIPRDEDQHRIKFQQWTNGFNKRQEKRLCLVNKQKSGFVCTVELEGPFVFVSTSSSSPQRYELQDAQTLREGPQRTFNLVQNTHLELVIKFDGPQPNNLVDWPMNYKVYKTGKLNVYFANGDEQRFELEGVLLRPYVHLNTSGIQNVEGPQTLDFGTVHINNKQTMMVHLSNLSAVPALWKLNYVRYPVKKNLVEQTMTLLDKEDQLKTDDQSVFEFQVAEGTLQGPSTMVHTLPHASALPYQITLKEIYDLGIEPHKILVNFRPKKNILYKSKYRITVQDGPAVEFILKGTGTYEENYEKQYD